jgi:hypothetical protein
MKHVLVALLVCTMVAVAAPASATPINPCHRRAWVSRTMGEIEREARVSHLISCAAARWWRGGAGTALAIASRESGLVPWAVSPSGTYVGLFQHSIHYWPGRRDAYLRRSWFRTWPVPWWNARAAVIVSVRMMAAQGGACPAWC